MRTPISIYALSDLHLEVSKYSGSPPEGTDIIVAAGDIGVGLDGLKWAASWGLPVIYVPGNHEFETHDFATLSDQLHAEAAKHKDVHVLQKESAIVKGVRFLGATLWTDFEYFGRQYKDDAMAFCQRGMPEYAAVHHGGRLLLAEDTLAWHDAERAWLDFNLKQPCPGDGQMETVVVTHQAPHKNSVAPMYQTQLLTAAFASHCDELLGRCGHWIHGHMHMSFDYMVEGTRVICNPRGYSRRQSGAQPDFNAAMLIEVGA
jgi:hypothetical protein